MKQDMLSTKQWEFLLICSVVFALTLNVWSSFYWKRGSLPEASGTLAAEFGPPDKSFRRAILAMQVNSPLRNVGAKVGDLIKYDNPIDSIRFLGVEDAVSMTLISAAQTSHVSLKPIPELLLAQHPVPILLNTILNFAIAFTAIAFGTLIGVRRAESNTMRMFSLVLVTTGLDSTLFNLPPNVFFGAPLMLIQPIADFVAYVCFTYVSLNLPEGNSHWRHRSIRRAFWSYVSVFAFVAIYTVAVNYELAPWILREYLDVNRLFETAAIASAILSLAALYMSWRISNGTLRQRLAWIGFCMGMIFVSYLFVNLNWLLSMHVADYLMGSIQNALMLPALCGLGYAALRHRLFDIGFAVNRALVVTALSGLLLFVFGITEWGVDKLLHFQGREKNVVFDALVALGIFLSFDRIQHWVNHKVDHIFFHSWYQAAERMRRFLNNAPHIVSPAALKEKFIGEVDIFVGASGCAIYTKLRDQGYKLENTTMENAPSLIDMDNDVVIEIASSRKFVYLADSFHALPGEMAFPMMVRGEISGLLLVGSKIRGDNFRIDEITLLNSAAHQIAMDIEGLRVTELEKEIKLSAQTLDALQHQLFTANEKAAMLERMGIASLGERAISS